MALAIALMIGPAEAQYMAIGLGNMSCGAWTAARRQNQAMPYEQWVLGFLSGLGWTGWDPLRDMDAEGVWAWMDNYCQAHPIEQIRVASAGFGMAHPH